MKKFKNSKIKWSTNTQGKLCADLAGEEKIYLFGLSDYYKSQKNQIT
jgi:hypothetical protein